MYKILIVDDEEVERDGIKFLINKYKINLDVAEAQNGEIAIQYLKDNHIDILLTDIKMPFMDGLDLSYEAKKINPKLKIIIFSAYGEFEYAKKAIKNNTLSYLLKPIEIDEFLDVINNAINICSKEEEEEKNARELADSYNRMLVYEKEKVLLDLINGEEIDDNFKKRMDALQLDFQGKNINMLMIDLQTRFFDSRNDEFEGFLRNILEIDFEYLNINEYQSIIFLNISGDDSDRKVIEQLGEKIKKEITNDYGVKPCLIFGKPICALEDFCKEHRAIEQKYDLKFFYEDGIVLFTSDTAASNPASTDVTDNILNEVYKAIDSQDTNYSIVSVKRLFDCFRNNASYSAIFVKYICVDIAKKISTRLPDKICDFKACAEELFLKDNIVQLEEEIIHLLTICKADQRDDGDETCKRVIKKVIEIIEKEYMSDVSLEYISEKVYLSPSYLSYIFKKETGQSLVKYITLFRLGKAKELLDNSNMRIIDIGESVGYPNLSYFCMLFKNNYGMTPAKYRERV